MALSINVSDTVRIGREALRPLEPVYLESPYFEVKLVCNVTWTPTLARAPSVTFTSSSNIAAS